MSIKSARMSAKLTQQEVANQLNVGRTAVAMWETSDVMPRVETLVKLSSILGCSIDELLKND